MKLNSIQGNGGVADDGSETKVAKAVNQEEEGGASEEEKRQEGSA